MLKNGATTLWERWELLAGNGMNSHNHPVFGCIDAWFFRYLAGINPSKAGFSEVLIRPYIPSNLNMVHARISTVRGDVISKWNRTGNMWTLDITIPWNSNAIIELPLVLGSKHATDVFTEERNYLIGKVGEVNKDRLVIKRSCGTWGFTVQYI